jgi:hypothetical protein
LTNQDLEDMLVRLERQFKGEAAARGRAEKLLSDTLSKQAVLQQQLSTSRQQQEREQAAIQEVGHHHSRDNAAGAAAVFQLYRWHPL